ncbi:MAG TPA: ABC transporter substrate-binding protein [Kiloniellales bacterium]|nr:ABC transporter substrate-binding protein [Kiloniellales bacterium]
MRRTRRAFLGQCLLAAAAVLTSRSGAAGAPIKIGAPGNFTGAFAALGTSMANGEALKVREINDAGGVLGAPLHLVVTDMASDRTRAPAIAAELLDQENVSAVVGFGDSDFVLALGPYVAARGLPFLTPGATSPLLPQQIGPTLYLACFADNVQAAAGAEFLAGTLGAKRVHVLHNESAEYTRLLARYFVAAHEQGGGTVGLSATYGSSDGQALAAVTEVMAAAPPADAIYLAALPEEAGALIARLRALGLSLPIVGGDGYDTPLLLEQVGTEATGIYYSTHVYLGDNPAPPVLDFMSRYWMTYGYGRIDAYAALGYDAIGLLAEAITQAGSTEPRAVLAALARVDGYSGITGRISYAPGQQVPQKPVSMVALERGKHRLAAVLTPAWVPPA